MSPLKPIETGFCETVLTIAAQTYKKATTQLAFKLITTFPRVPAC